MRRPLPALRCSGPGGCAGRRSGSIDRLRAAELRPAEEQLEARYRELGALAVEDSARTLAHRWPGGRTPASEVARRILRRAAGERREELAGRARAWLDEPVAALSPLRLLDD